MSETSGSRNLLARVGERLLSTGARLARIGRFFSRIGVLVPTTGAHRALTGRHFSLTGRHFLSTGARRALTGRHLSPTGARRALTGRHLSPTGAHRALTGALPAFIAILLASSCGRDERRETPPVDGMITLSISVAEADEHSSRGGTPLPGTAEESRIKTLKIFVFRSDDNTLEQYKGVLINDNNTSDDPSWNAATKSLRVVITPGNKRVYCVANWAATPDAEMPELSDQTIADTATLLAVTRAHGGVTPRNPPVMSGRMTRNITGAEQELGITIERQVAMVNIYPMLSPLLGALDANVTIEGVKFTRLAGASYLFPRVPAVNPAGVAWDQSAFEGVSSARVTATTPAAAVKYPVTYYIPENIAADENAATRVTVKAIYNGATVYYSLPLRGEGVPSPHAVERNHAYNYYLTIQGVGAATVALAPRRSL